MGAIIYYINHTKKQIISFGYSNASYGLADFLDYRDRLLQTNQWDPTDRYELAQIGGLWEESILFDKGYQLLYTCNENKIGYYYYCSIFS